MEALEGDEPVGSLGTKKAQFDPSTLFPKRSNAAVHFDAFPMGRWEVVWLGDVGYHSRHMMYSQPTVTVVLAPLDDQSSGNCEIKLPVAQLFAVYLGSIWHDKIRTDETSVDAERRTIVLTTRQAVPCAVGVGLEDELSGGFMLPFEDFAHHREHTKSWCLRVKLPEAIYIFPALELIRFYFGSSGSLLKQVFSPGLDINRLATERSLHEGSAKVTLSYDMPYVSASDIARICFDKVAQDAARLVGTSLQAASSVNSYGKLYPRAAFPFSGRTELSVAGVLIQTQSGKPRFLVQRIISCSAAFPFKRLDYVASNQSKRHGSQKLGKTAKAESSDKAQAMAKRNTSGPLANSEPRKSKSTQHLLLEPEARFIDLLRKPVSRVDGEAARQVLLLHLPPSTLGSTGDGASSAGPLRCDLTLEKDHRQRMWRFKSPVESWKPFFHFLSWLAGRSWIEHLCFVPIDSRQAHPHFRAIPEIIDEDGVLLNETLTIQGIPRMASLVNIVAEGRKAALLCLSPRHPDNIENLILIHEFSFSAGGALPELASVLTEQIPIHCITTPLATMTESDFATIGEAIRSRKAKS
jgi:hypothetical protein